MLFGKKTGFQTTKNWQLSSTIEKQIGFMTCLPLSFFKSVFVLAILEVVFIASGRSDRCLA